MTVWRLEGTMNYSIYTDYLKEARLYEAFRKECDDATWLILNPDMLLVSSDSFIYEHCSFPLDQIADDLFGSKMRIHPSAGHNYDMIVYFKWLLVFLHLEMTEDIAKEEQEVQRYRGKNKELLVQDLERTKMSYKSQEERVIEFLTVYGQKQAEALYPDEAISIYRELWKLANCNTDRYNSRPSYEDLQTLRPLVLDAKYHLSRESEPKPIVKKPEIHDLRKIPPFRPDFKNAKDQLAKGLQDRVGDFQKLVNNRHSDTHKLEEKLRKTKKAFELQEMMEFVTFTDLLIANCAKKYFM